MRKLLRRNEFFLALLIVALGIGFTLANPKFATIGNLLDLIKSFSFFGILSVGVLVVLLSGGIDISFTAIAQVAEYASVALILQFGGNLWTAFLVACCIGIVLGAVNGLLIHFIRIPPIITTIGTLCPRGKSFTRFQIFIEHFLARHYLVTFPCSVSFGFVQLF